MWGKLLPQLSGGRRRAGKPLHVDPVRYNHNFGAGHSSPLHYHAGQMGTTGDDTRAGPLAQTLIEELLAGLYAAHGANYLRGGKQRLDRSCEKIGMVAFELN